MADVFPPRDLPGRAEEWGRQVERRIESGEASEVQLEQKVDNGLRATGGQLAVLAGQINALPLVSSGQGQFDIASLTSTVWTSVGSITVKNPGGKNSVSVNLFLNELFPVSWNSGPAPFAEVRLVVNGEAGFTYRMSQNASTSANDFYFTSSIGESFQVPIADGEDVIVEAETRLYGNLGTFATGYANLYGLGIFTRV